MITPTSLDKLSKMDDRDLDTTLNRLQRSIFKTRKSCLKWMTET